MFDKILIANRGEIACRVMRTARRMGLASVAIYSEADRDALHVKAADEAVAIGPAPAAQSYLVIERIVEAARASGAEAVHPGYGFLSENADFAEALAAEGIAFVGPGSEAIRAMGDKIAAKKLAHAAGVSTVPGHLGIVDGAEQALAVAREIGYPVMVKAAAGGGGKGMRIARDDGEMREGYVRAASEARSSFGDERLFIEKFIVEPRHIEIQVLADGHGNVVHLGERECSIQRRHQKVIEEAPSPFIDAETRAAMGAQAVALARQVGYRSAGTVEFIVDGERSFYFLEMNTRLQVEHPVTELVTGIDLVEQMIRIAAGERLSIAQADVALDGWALECRIYAEDPRRNFLPSVGRLVRYLPPAEGEGVRIDSGVAEGSEISLFYDPMIAKLCTFGPDRAAAIERMRSALDDFYIRGVSHNVHFLNAVIGLDRFAQGRLSTELIAQEFPEGYEGAVGAAERETLIAVAATLHCRQHARERDLGGANSGGAPARTEWVVSLVGESVPLTIEGTADGEHVRWEDGDHFVRGAWRFGAPVFHGVVDDRAVAVQVEPRPEGYRLSYRGATADVVIRTPRAAELASRMRVKKHADSAKQVRSPMPGLVISINAAEGQEVKAGEVLAVIEAMKMENVLRAAHDGVVAQVLSAPGDSLAVDQVILEFE